MRTLFLNPNSSNRITAVFRQHIDARVKQKVDYQVKLVDGAPPIIASADDNARASHLLQERFEDLSIGFSRVVLMSSLDTGFDCLHGTTEIEVCGFTRSVLAWHRSRGQRLQAITFDDSMTPLYQRLFAADGNDGVVHSITAVEISPLDVAGSQKAALLLLQSLCQRLARTSTDPIFIVGAVGLELAECLRSEHRQVIDPVDDMLAYLGISARQPMRSEAKSDE